MRILAILSLLRLMHGYLTWRLARAEHRASKIQEAMTCLMSLCDIGRVTKVK